MPNKKLAYGLERNTAAALAYIGIWISGLIFFLIEKEDKFVRFHALQSIVVFGGLTIAMIVPVLGWALAPLIWVLGFVLWLVCIVKAYQGERFFVPFVGRFVEKKLKDM